MSGYGVWQGICWVDALVRTRVVEVAGVFLHDAIQVTFAQYDEVIQTFTLETAQETLADSISLRRAIGSAQYINAGPESNT